MSDNSSVEAMLVEFLFKYLADLEAGTPGTIEEYRREFPDCADQIEDEFGRLREDGLAEADEVSLLSIHEANSKPAKQELNPGESIGRYRVERFLGAGGMGAVYLATDPSLDRPVAVKVLPPEFGQSRARLRRFEQEARTLARLNHPNIATIFSFEGDGAKRFITMEWIDGESLADRLVRGPLTVPETRSLAEQVLAALDAAADARIVHRDLKPANILIRSTGLVKVLDFGLAKTVQAVALDLESDASRAGALIGTPGYMCPEQLRGDPVDTRSDLWAFGAILYECLTGTRAFGGKTLEAVLTATLLEPPDMDRLPAETTPALRSVIELCLYPTPDRRPSSADQILEGLAVDHDTLSATQLLSTPSERLPVRSLERTLPDVLVELQLLRRLAQAHERVPFRLTIRNEARESVLASYVWTDDPHWETDRDQRTVEVGPRETVYRVDWARPRTVGKLTAPAIQVQAGESEFRSSSEPSWLTVNAAPEHNPSVSLPDSFERVVEDPDRFAGSLLTVVGDRGLGKSVLLQDLARRFRERGYRDLRAFVPATDSLPLKVFHDWLRELVVIPETLTFESSDRTGHQRLLEVYVGQDSHAAQFFASELFGSSSKEPLPESLKQLHWYRLFAAAAAECPIVLVADNFSYAGRDSWALLRDLLSRAREEQVPILALVSYRQSQSTSNLEESGDATAFAEFFREAPVLFEAHRLAPLSAREVSDWLDRALPELDVEDDLPWLPEVLHERSAGVPAFLAELVESLTDSPEPILRMVDGRLRAARTISRAEFEALLPSGRREVASRVIAALSQEVRPVLEFASLLGVEFSVAILESVVPDQDQLDRSLDELEAAGVITPISTDLDTYRFANNALAEAASQSLSQRGQRRLRKMKRELVEAVKEARDGRAYAAWLGKTLLELGEPEEAEPFAAQALRQQVRTGEYAKALSLLSQFDPEFERSPGDFTHYFRQAARVRIGLGQLDQAREAAQRLVEATRSEPRSQPYFDALLLSFEIENRSGRLESAESFLKEARQCAETQNDSAQLLSVENSEAIYAYFRGRREEARAKFERCLELLPDSDRSGDAVRFQLNLGRVALELDRLDEAHAAFRGALDGARATGNLDFGTIARTGLANTEYALGHYEEARAGYLEALETNRLLQNRNALARNYDNLAEIELLLGRPDRARLATDRSLELWRSIGDRLGLAEVLTKRAQLWWLVGETERALKKLELAREEAAQGGARSYLESSIELRLNLVNGDPPAVSTEELSPVDRILRAWVAARYSLETGAELDFEVDLELDNLERHSSGRTQWFEVSLLATLFALGVRSERLDGISAAQLKRRSAPGIPVENLVLFAKGVSDEAIAETRARLEARASAIEDSQLREGFIRAASCELDRLLRGSRA